MKYATPRKNNIEIPAIAGYFLFILYAFLQIRIFKYALLQEKPFKRGKMAKKCIYCKTDVAQESVIDFCERCGVGVWGEKMFRAIVKGMEGARETGNLHQGSITDPMLPKRRF
jgi:hypothetical protein